MRPRGRLMAIGTRTSGHLRSADPVSFRRLCWQEGWRRSGLESNSCGGREAVTLPKDSRPPALWKRVKAKGEARGTMVSIDMLTPIQFLEEISKKDLAIPPADVERMRQRFGEKVLKMGHIQEDGSMLVPVDCVLEAAQSLEPQTLTEAAETLKSDEMVKMLQSGESLVERVGEARERKLRELIRKFQSESNEADVQGHWKQIEKTIFGVDYPD